MRNGYYKHYLDKLRRQDDAKVEAEHHGESKGLGCDKHTAYLDGCADCQHEREEYDKVMREALRGWEK